MATLLRYLWCCQRSNNVDADVEPQAGDDAEAVEGGVPVREETVENNGVTSNGSIIGGDRVFSGEELNRAIMLWHNDGSPPITIGAFAQRYLMHGSNIWWAREFSGEPLGAGEPLREEWNRATLLWHNDGSPPITNGAFVQRYLMQLPREPQDDEIAPTVSVNEETVTVSTQAALVQGESEEEATLQLENENNANDNNSITPRNSIENTLDGNNHDSSGTVASVPILGHSVVEESNQPRVARRPTIQRVQTLPARPARGTGLPRRIRRSEAQANQNQLMAMQNPIHLTRVRLSEEKKEEE